MKRNKLGVIIFLAIIILFLIGIFIKRDVHFNNNEYFTQDSIAINSSNINENANELDLRFFDQITGCSVVPENIEITPREPGKSNNIISNKQISKNGSVMKHLSNGLYDITVDAKGYKPLKTFFNLKDQTIYINFNLDPINIPKELSDSLIQSLHKTGIMAVVGCIVDEYKGAPLERVKINTSDEIVKTFSSKKGFFQIMIPLPESDDDAKLRGTIYFSLDQYITEVRENFDMWSNGDYVFKIKMIKGSGLNRVSVIDNREVSREILPKKAIR